jgi:DNA replication protein DnaC
MGDGWLLLDDKAHRCPCSIERKLVACVPEKYRIARLKDFNGAIRQFIRSWVQKPTAGLLIFGRVGTGKTHLAAAILRGLLEAQARVDFRRCAQFFADLQESYRANTSSEAIVGDLENSQFLILDDVGSGALSDHERRFTLELIERRINQNRPTILTSNWSRQEIGEKLDARISSRLALFTELELSGADLREVRGDRPL